jgi:hypothetical protein
LPDSIIGAVIDVRIHGATEAIPRPPEENARRLGSLEQRRSDV